MPISVSSVGPGGSQESKVFSQDQNVKMQERQGGGFVPMKNKELLQKIKKSGKKADEALKV